MANHRNGLKKRNVFKALLALSIGCVVSISLPSLRGEPPKATGFGQKSKEKSEDRFPIGFSKNQTPKSSGSEKPARNDGRLTADVARATNEQNTPDADVAKSINVATDEEKNQKIAADWKDPLVVFFITGNQSGYIEPCGCTGLENQKGGLSRRDTLLTAIRQRGWNVVPIDGGGQVFQEHEMRRRGRQSDIKFSWTASAFKLLDYQVATFGEDDLRLTIDALLHPMIDKAGLFVSANVSILPDYDMKYKTVLARDKKIGITAVLGEENAKKVDNSDISISKAIPALKEVVLKMRADKCDFMVLISHASLEESRTIAKAVPEFSLIVTSGGFGEPTYQPEQIPGTPSLMVQVGTKGMYAGLFGVYDSPKNSFRYQRIALSSQFEDSPRVTELFNKYQDELKAVTIEGLGKRPITHPTMREFVGSEKCGECHTTAFEIWKDTPHARATDSIVQPPHRSMARHFDPECISCHVTGWNPQNFFPYRTGYESLESTPHMVANGCENCHGPGSKHVAAEEGGLEADVKLLGKLRDEMKLPLDQASDKCAECHDIDNSPDFHKPNALETYWEKIKHSGKD